MGHHHHHHHDQKTSSIKVAFWLNFSFAIIELIGGVMVNSTAIISDAVHDMGDALVLLMSVLMDHQRQKPATKRFSYGWQRLSIIGALLNSGILLMGTMFILSKAVATLMNPEPVQATGMFGLAILGVIANGISIAKMHGNTNILERSVFVHLLEDLLGWVAVLVVSIVIYFTQWYWLDAVVSLVIAGVVLLNVGRNVYQLYHLIMLATPDMDEQVHLQKAMEQMTGVQKIDSFHWWSLDGEHHVLTVQLHIEPNADTVAIRQQIDDLCQQHHIVHSTIEWL